MQDTIARQVHRVFGAGLELKERLERGDRPDFDTEYTRLKGLLLTDGELRTQTDYAGDDARDGRNTIGGPRGREPFFGLRYALVCWLDEVFIDDSAWGDLWRRNALEVALYGAALRAERFWEQAKKAEARPGTDAVEAYLWCVMLGFRGEPPADLKPTQWADGVRKRVLAALAHESPLPADLNLPTSVPVLRSRERFATMIRIAVGVGAVVAFTAAALAVAYVGRGGG